MVAPPPPPPPPPPSTTISASTALLGVDVDEDPDFDPQFEVAEDTEQILNKLDNAPPERSPEREKAERRASSQALAVFSLEPPKLHAIRSATEHGQQIVTRILGMMAANDQSKAIDHQPGFNRLASVAHANGVEGWSIIAERLATRYQIGLQAQAEAMIKYEQSNNLKLDDYIRELLYSSVMEDFRLRMPLAISWLCEEWMNDQIASRMSVNPVLHYEQWALRILDGIIPYLDSKDKVLTRFVGEIPHITEGMISRIMELCRNPEMISLSIMTLFYVASMKPPAREAAMDAMQDVYSTCKLYSYLSSHHTHKQVLTEHRRRGTFYRREAT